MPMRRFLPAALLTLALAGPLAADLSVVIRDKDGRAVGQPVPVPVGGWAAVVEVPKAPAPPTPPPNPQPQPTRFFVVVVEETGQAAGTRGAMLQDAALAQRFKDQGHRWRVVDKDVVGPDGRPPADVKPFLDAAAGVALPQLFLIAPDGSVRYKGDRPATAAALLDLIKRYGG